MPLCSVGAKCCCPGQRGWERLSLDKNFIACKTHIATNASVARPATPGKSSSAYLLVALHFPDKVDGFAQDVVLWARLLSCDELLDLPL